MMAISILFFGATADITQTRKLDLDVEPDDSSEKVLARLIEKFPPLKGQRLLISRNRSYADRGEIVRDGDEIAIFTAVSGG